MVVVKKKSRARRPSKTKASLNKSPLENVNENIKIPPTTINFGEEGKAAVESKLPESIPAIQEPIEKNKDDVGALPAEDKKIPEEEEPAENVNSFDSNIGWVKLRGERYDFDVVVHADGSVGKRNKELSKKKKGKYGHTPLTRSELKVFEMEAPVMFIIGTGHSDSMPVTPNAMKFLDDYLYFIGKTPEALKQLAMCEEKVVALLHVTC